VAQVSTVRLLLSPGSLYVFGGEARYTYKHAVVAASKGPQHWKDAGEVVRGRRISLILRPEFMYQSIFTGVYGTL